ncbi:hypothetical protein Goshw_010109, partial [Gossypium schwendimanii]|nr:hypothetical protein [Gossypium schwendimanii]
MDFNTDNRIRGRFVRMAVYVNLDKPLVSQVLANGALQRFAVEKEQMKSASAETVGGRYGVVFGSWMVVEKKARQNSPDFKNQKINFSRKEGSRSKFDALSKSQISEAWRVRRLRQEMEKQRGIRGNLKKGLNQGPLIPTGNVNDVLDKLALEVTGPISKSCGNNPVGLFSISSRPVEVYSVGVEHIEKPHVAGPSCKNSVVVRDRKEAQITVSIFRSDNPGGFINAANSNFNKSPTVLNAGKHSVVTFKENNDPNARKHSVVTFKENNDPNGGRLRSGEDHIRGCDMTIVSKRCGQGAKGGQIGSGRRLNWTIRDHRE